MSATYCWKVFNVVFLSFVNYCYFIINTIIKTKRQYSERKSRPLKLACSKMRLWAKSLHVTMVSCLLGFIFSGNANCVTGLYRAWRFGNRLVALKYCEKDQNRARGNAVSSNPKHAFRVFSEVWKGSLPNIMYCMQVTAHHRFSNCKLWNVIFNVEVDKNMSKILHVTGVPNKLAFNQPWKRIPFRRCKKWGSANIFRKSSFG